MAHQSNHPNKEDESGSSVASNKRFDAERDPGARVIRGGEKAAAQDLIRAGANPNSANRSGTSADDPNVHAARPTGDDDRVNSSPNSEDRPNPQSTRTH